MSEVNVITAPTPLTQPFNRGKNAGCACLANVQAALVNIRAIGALVIKELFRRKDFYALFILTALITLILGSINFFNEAHVVRYVKEICLFLIWTSSLVIAMNPPIRVGCLAARRTACRAPNDAPQAIGWPETRGRISSTR